MNDDLSPIFFVLSEWDQAAAGENGPWQDRCEHQLIGVPIFDVETRLVFSSMIILFFVFFILVLR